MNARAPRAVHLEPRARGRVGVVAMEPGVFHISEMQSRGVGFGRRTRVETRFGPRGHRTPRRADSRASRQAPRATTRIPPGKQTPPTCAPMTHWLSKVCRKTPRASQRRPEVSTAFGTIAMRPCRFKRRTNSKSSMSTMSGNPPLCRKVSAVRKSAWSP